MFRNSFGRGVKIGPTFTDFFVCKIHIIIWTSHPRVSYIWSPSPSALVGAPKYFWFHQFMACIVMRISRPNYEKSVEKGHLYENSYVKSPPPTQVVGPRGTQMILISSVYGMHRYGNLATTLWKKCWRRAPFWKGNLSWNTIECGCPLSPGARGFAHPEPIGVTPLCNAFKTNEHVSEKLKIANIKILSKVLIFSETFTSIHIKNEKRLHSHALSFIPNTSKCYKHQLL